MIGKESISAKLTTDNRFPGSHYKYAYIERIDERKYSYFDLPMYNHFDEIY